MAGPVPAAAPVGADAAGRLPLADGRVLVLGTAGGAPVPHAALWRLHRDGTLDRSFAGTGLLVASGVPDSRGLSIQGGAEGMLHIALQSGRADQVWLEVHRWPAGMDAPLRVARQRVPDNWVGPAVLTRRGQDWIWVDSGQPKNAPLSPTAVTRDSPWTRAVPAAPPAPEPVSSVGQAIFDPFAGAPRSGHRTRAAAPDAGSWTATLLALGALLAAGASAWWWRRR